MTRDDSGEVPASDSLCITLHGPVVQRIKVNAKHNCSRNHSVLIAKAETIYARCIETQVPEKALLRRGPGVHQITNNRYAAA